MSASLQTWAPCSGCQQLLGAPMQRTSGAGSAKAFLNYSGFLQGPAEPFLRPD
jgi:hypothetical protein